VLQDVNSSVWPDPEPGTGTPPLNAQEAAIAFVLRFEKLEIVCNFNSGEECFPLLKKYKKNATEIKKIYINFVFILLS
jgi:hypothetical protein